MTLLVGGLLALLFIATSCVDMSTGEVSRSAVAPQTCETSFDCDLGGVCDDLGTCVAQP